MRSMDNASTRAFDNTFLTVQSMFLPQIDSEWFCAVHTIKFSVEGIFLFSLFDDFGDVAVRKEVLVANCAV